MTPLQITMLFHYHHIAERWPRPDAPACQQATQWFLDEKLIEATPDTSSGYRTTDRGDALVNHLCSVEPPVCKWVQPDHPTNSDGRSP
jgi:hypothetical protein